MGWRLGSAVKYIVLRNLEAKFLKAGNLHGLVCDASAGRDGAVPGIFRGAEGRAPRLFLPLAPERPASYP